MQRRLHSRRRTLIGAAASLAFPCAVRGGRADEGATLSFDELYRRTSVLGLEFSDKTMALASRHARMKGFMARTMAKR